MAPAYDTPSSELTENPSPIICYRSTWPTSLPGDIWTTPYQTLSESEIHGHLCEHHSPLAWPLNGRYFDPHVMNAATVLDLNVRDTSYVQMKDTLTYMDLTSEGPFQYHASLHVDALPALKRLASTIPIGGSRVLFIPQRRIYTLHLSIVQVGLNYSAWMETLNNFSIPPNVVELLHDNNGGSWEHLSHCSDTTVNHEVDRDTDSCAYHLCFKMCGQDFLYVRYDFHTKSSFVLLMGRNQESVLSRLRSQSRSLQSVHLFHILLAILSSWFQELERVRRSLDFSVVMLESNTGHGQCRYNVKPLPPQDFSLVRKVVTPYRAWPGDFQRHSGHMGELLANLSHSVIKFEGLQGAAKNARVEQIVLDTISQHQSQQKAQERQARDLRDRMDMQWSVSGALIADHDTGVAIQMAQDARTDSLLMRRMAAVSIIFLPATFLATFFSMMFFRVDSGGRLSVNSNMWVYFVSTSAISLMIMLHFRYGNDWKISLGEMVRSCRETSKSVRKRVEDAV
jgi:Mg2+ and Co2+ transporter CorA